MIAVLDEEQRAGDTKLELLINYGSKHTIPKQLIDKCYVHIRNKNRSNEVGEEWDFLFETFPPILQKEIVEVTQIQIVKEIKFF